MSHKRLWVLFGLGLLVAGLAAGFQSSPGYMDAAYYYSGGLRLAQAQGFTEEIIWNYLDDPAGLPHSSHTYWMPLASVVAWLGIALAPFLSSFDAAQLGFIFVAALVPPLTASLSYTLGADEKKATLAGLLAVFSGFYLAFATTTDAFGLVMLLGGLFFLVVSKPLNWKSFALIGLLAGLMHMSRADGTLWLVIAFLAVWWKREELNAGQGFFAVLVGFLFVVSPWMARNWAEYGTLFAPGSSQALWFLDYNELFAYPASKLTFARWWEAGLPVILKPRLEALWANFQTAFAVQGMIFLGPLGLAVAWKRRREYAVKLGWTAWLLVFLAMTLAFPFSGGRGGFFHSGAAFMPLVWALTPLGLEQALVWAAERRGWKMGQARLVFQTALVVLAALLTVLLAAPRLVGPQATWNIEAQTYEGLEAHLVSLGAGSEDVVMVNNPPAYYAANGRSAIVIPDGGEDTLLEVVEKYQPDWVIIEFNHPQGLNDLYESPHDLPGLKFLETYNGTHFFRVESP